MKTFCVQTLGCKVNQYESEQLAALLRARGWAQTSPDHASVRIINTCSVTVQAASQSRQAVRRMTRLPVLWHGSFSAPADRGVESAEAQPAPVNRGHPSVGQSGGNLDRPRVVVTGCWATSDKPSASALPGVDAVLTHHDDVAADLDRLLTLWQSSEAQGHASSAGTHNRASELPPGSMTIDGWRIEAGTAAGERTLDNKPESPANVNILSLPLYKNASHPGRATGTNSLPLLGQHQTGRQRAFLKVQDGCDAHCTYCIIPRLRPTLVSKSIGAALEEARRLVASGHVEIVLTGIFLGAYGQATALRRRQVKEGIAPLGELVEALCTKVPGLRRLRLSSLEPGDLSDRLLRVLTSHEQVVPHFHLPLQSGSNEILRRMNRQYRRDDFLDMIERVKAAFDRPALTTDVIVGFPGETEEEFQRTVEIAEAARFIHIHAFPFSPRPGTAAARWAGQFVHGPIVNRRIELLRQKSHRYSLEFRSTFVGEVMEVITERDAERGASPEVRHGRCSRYFPVWFDGPNVRAGDLVRVRVERVTPTRTFGTVEKEGIA